MLIKMKVHGLALDPFTNSPIVILKDLDNQNTLPIWIGILEASAIATQLENVQPARPMTHDLLRDILRRMNAAVSKIVVTDIKDNIYYALIHIMLDANDFMIDARPSDAIAVALRTNSNIYVDDKVFKKSKTLLLSDDKVAAPDETRKWEDILENLSSNDFGKYKM